MKVSRVWTALLAALAAGLASGSILWQLAGLKDAAQVVWAATTCVGLIPILLRFISEVRARRLGVDIIAVLAMAGCLALGEFVAGAVIALMFASGQFLEVYAQERAKRELTALAARSPREGHRILDGHIATVPATELCVGDVLLVKSGDLVPVDGRVSGGNALVDESALTGEAIPVERSDGDHVKSGIVNAGPPFQMVATSTAADSTYAGIVRMVEAAQASRAPLVRLADRYSVFFLVATLLIAGGAWLVSGSAIRALAILVVATPCPLIIAAPVAIVAGVSRAARAGVVVKGGAVLEQLSQVRVLLFDKTGTLTKGKPMVRDVITDSGFAEADLLAAAASLDQMSSHPLASALRAVALDRGFILTTPTAVKEEHGAGISGSVDGHDVRLGRADFVAGRADTSFVGHVKRRAAAESISAVFVAIDGRLAGAVLVGDDVRPDSARTVRKLREAGVNRIVMVTGDHADIAQAMAAAAGVDGVMAEHSPEEKALLTATERAEHGCVAFVGDGINDAPALASADVGIAIGSRGVSAASEAADAILVVDRLDNLAQSLHIARRSRTIALQSVVAGMGMSIAAMIAAAFGLLVPVAGAILQEGIDLVVILNSLRALGGSFEQDVPAALTHISRRLRQEHEDLASGIGSMSTLADSLGGMNDAEAARRLADVRSFVVERLMPHEEQEERDYYPMVARQIGGTDPTAAMFRGHIEIRRLARLLVASIDGCEGGGLSTADVTELRRLLYALNAVLVMHNVQEEDAYLSLVPAV